MKCKALHKYYLFVECVVDSPSFNHTIPLCHIHVLIQSLYKVVIVAAQFLITSGPQPSFYVTKGPKYLHPRNSLFAQACMTFGLFKKAARYRQRKRDALRKG